MRNDFIKHKKPINIGFVGGGDNNSIGLAHRIAARMDMRYNLCSGVFSSNPSKSKRIAKKLGIKDDRAYSDFSEMAKKEKLRKDGISVVSIMTPPSSHFKIAKEFLKKNYKIICDKPFVTSSKEANILKSIAQKNKIPFCMTYNYSGYPLVREAKEIIAKGVIGKIIHVNVEYLQGQLVGLNKNNFKKELKWRANNSCGSLVLSEIGTHAFHLAEFVTGLKVSSVYAKIQSNFINNIDDNANILINFKKNIQGSIWVSFSTLGGESGLKFRIHGTKGTLEWLQDNPNIMKINKLKSPMQIVTRGSSFLGKEANQVSRISKGHPEGYFEAFANIYSDFADFIQKEEKKFIINSKTFPTLEDGLRGIKFIESAKKSSINKKWIKI